MEQGVRQLRPKTLMYTSPQETARHVSANTLGIALPPGYHVLETQTRLILCFGDEAIRTYPTGTSPQQLERDASRHAARQRAVGKNDFVWPTAVTDPLTGLPWTPAVIDDAAHMAAEADLHAICVHLVGLDTLIDSRGYRAVPAVFQRTAEALKPLLSKQDRLTRHSGDKLLIFTTRSLKEVEALVDRIHQEISAVAATVGTDGLPQSQIGVASLPQETDLDELGALIEALVISAEAASTATSPYINAPLEAKVTEEGSVQLPSLSSPPEAGAPQPPMEATAPERRNSFEEFAQHESLTDHPAPSPAFASAVAPSQTHEERGGRTHSVEATEAVPVGAEKAAASRSKRLVLIEANLDLAGQVATATVEIMLGNQRVKGKAVGRNSEERRLPLVAEAAARATTEFLPRGYGVTIQHVDHAPAEVGPALWTLAFLLTPTGEQALLGIAPADHNFTRAAATCVLNALNRRIGILLSEQN